MSTATKEKPVAKKKTDLKLQPLGDRVVVRRESSEAKTAGGIVPTIGAIMLLALSALSHVHVVMHHFTSSLSMLS